MRNTWTLLALAFALVPAACGGGTGEEAIPEPADAPEAVTDDDPDAGVGHPSVMVAQTGLGDALVDADGMALYLFTDDQPGASTCYDDCAANWPPLEVDGDPVAGDGADDALLGITERDDGVRQVTYNDWPLYHFAGDGAAGDVEGQGAADVWWLVDPDGEPVEGAADDDAHGQPGGY